MNTLFVTFNLNDLNANAKWKTIFNYFKSKKFEIVLLQETHSTVIVKKNCGR